VIDAVKMICSVTFFNPIKAGVFNNYKKSWKKGSGFEIAV